jgi:hypothetical protein
MKFISGAGTSCLLVPMARAVEREMIEESR